MTTCVLRSDRRPSLPWRTGLRNRTEPLRSTHAPWYNRAKKARIALSSHEPSYCSGSIPPDGSTDKERTESCATTPLGPGLACPAVCACC